MPAAAKRRRPSRARLLSRRALNALFALALLVCALGFAYYTRIAVYRQETFAPGAEHPYDWEAEGCLILALLALAACLLNRTEPRRTQWFGPRVPTAKRWRQARQTLRFPAAKTAKRIRRL